MCKEFVDNIKTAFSTKPLPFSVENLALTNNISNNTNSNSSSDMQSLAKSEDSLLEISSGLIDLPINKNTSVMPRYAAIRNEIEILLVNLIRNFMSVNGKGQPLKRPNPQSTLGSSFSVVNSIDNKNFIKLLQQTCGFGEVRAIALSKIENWLLNQKVFK